MPPPMTQPKRLSEALLETAEGPTSPSKAVSSQPAPPVT
jgi:hypothetical protein